MASSAKFQNNCPLQLNDSVQVEMGEVSIDHASMPGNSISKIEERKLAIIKEQDSEDMSNIDMPILYIFKKIIHTVFLIPAVLLVAIISPDESQFFIFSSFISMLLDPLFLYIPLIKEETKCLMLDKKLMIAALILRIVTDLRYVMKIGSKIKKWRGSPKEIAGSIATDVVAILPIPQVVVLVFLPRMRSSGSLSIMKFLNSLILFQYLQRVYPIYRYCKNLNKKIHLSSAPTRAWIPSLFNILIYILASYVLGTFWYFFSIQREIDCWEYACQSEKGCEFSTHCDANTFRNVTLLKLACPINPPNAATFDFGIFLYALQSGVQESTNVPQKLLLCFSWGLRNLSSFASNLNTSTYGWETLFVVAISISGLVLFIYFLGHVQTFMQVAGKSERSRQKWKKILEPKIESMLSEYDLPAKVKKSIDYVVKKKDLEDPDLLLENMSSIFTFKREVDDQTLLAELTSIRHSLFLEKLKRVLHRPGTCMNDMVLKEICKHLDPVIYPKGSYIIHEGEPLDMMFFITQGIALEYTTDRSITTSRLEKGDCYGEELILSWAATATTSFSDLPNSGSTVKAHKNVEIFAIQAADLQRVLSQPSSQYSSNEVTHAAETKVIQSVLSQLRDLLIKPRWLTLG
ncbi:putative potassium channel, voltage-dependent, EAG/ELK/ERG [Rosa chinensis]|uniref:Putative potassium channel, voltage-dependent, EAG/ELK/ERG n=1 Tax=Rosa chinensis TaxID=74649 RepID=A0A2P6R9Z3_ROSCH|nr:cyclic nucleotide-gated ion channel 1 isoform X2 [Rosa chinensis]PRQ43252.1 putative potassium channel, voltage-dependent, EAG/ELK/ERG [Rosa chinensis]